jgi:hypothetical protein
VSLIGSYLWTKGSRIAANNTKLHDDYETKMIRVVIFYVRRHTHRVELQSNSNSDERCISPITQGHDLLISGTSNIVNFDEIRRIIGMSGTHSG